LLLIADGTLCDRLVKRLLDRIKQFKVFLLRLYMVCGQCPPYISLNINLPSGDRFDFLSQLSPEIQNALKVKDIRLSSNLIAPLVADDSSPFSFTETIPRIVSETGNKFTILSNTIAKPVSFSVEKAIQVSSSEVDTSEVTLKKLGTFDSNSLQVAIKEHHANHVTVNEFSISQIARVEPTTSKITVSPFNISEVDITPFGAIGNSKTSRLKLDSIQNSSTQIDVSPFESGKVSLPSVISSQKLVSSNLSHDNTYELNNIYFTAQTLWHTTTPIDLNFAITNLPTGQLAEATITGYDQIGRPNTATISIDDDANGVGWFIDTTPGDSSEFTGTDTYFQATPNSPASGKYDLLTAILHEMGHTLGFINGYSQFNQNIKGRQFYTDPTHSYTLSSDLSHLDNTLYPNDLLNTNLKPGIRKLPSTMDWAIINAINSGVGSHSRVGIAHKPFSVY
jgi:hypothetical protein